MKNKRLVFIILGVIVVGLGILFSFVFSFDENFVVSSTLVLGLARIELWKRREKLC